MKHPIVTGDGVLRMHKSSLTTRGLDGSPQHPDSAENQR